MGAYFSATATNMLKEHKRARQEADQYMVEVTAARHKLPNIVGAVFSNTSSLSGNGVA